MNPQLFKGLAKAIDDYMESAADKTYWPDFIYGRDTSLHMAKAAAAVVDACEESQKYAIREGYVSDPFQPKQKVG